MSTIWNFRETEPCAISEGEVLPYSSLTQKLLALRGLKDHADVGNFLFPSLDHLHDPFQLKDVSKAVRRILRAIDNEETIMVHGDYDADGITGTAILAKVLKRLNARFLTFLPRRATDGYGVSRDAIQQAAGNRASLLITVDCGVSAYEEIEEAKKSGMDVIVIDHHRVQEEKMPAALAIINPAQNECSYPFKELSAGGLAFKLAQALLGKGALEVLDLAAISTVCDMAPLTGENRILVSQGLEALSRRRNLGIRKLCEAAGLRRAKISASDIGFILGPRINACGRMGSADSALELLTTGDAERAGKLSEMLNEENKARQREERELLKLAMQKVEREVNFNRERVIVVSGDGWHEGVIGIVAQRIVENYVRPAVVFSFNEGVGKGSGRSVRGFHLFEAMTHAAGALEQFGGHEMAAGATIRKENLAKFRQKINEYAAGCDPDVFRQSIRIDCEIEMSELSQQFVTELSLLEPFGLGNPRPVFATKGLRTKRGPERDTRWDKFGKETYRWWVTDGTLTYEAVWKNKHRDQNFPETQPYALVYSPKIDSWSGMTSLILEVRDVKAQDSIR